MPNPIYHDSMVLLAKIETTYKTDAVPGAADAILATNVELSEPMMAETRDRALIRPFMGNDGELAGTPLRKLKCRFELAGSGAAGTAPKHGKLLRALGLSETVSAGVSVTYAPVSAGFESLSIYFWHDGLKHTLLGCRGSGDIRLSAQDIPYCEAEFTGFWAAPTDTAQVAPTLTGWSAPLLSSSVNTPTFTVGGTAAVLKDYGLTLGNQVEPYLLIGREEIMIVNRKESISAQIEALPVATKDLQAIVNARTAQAINVTQGTAAGNIVAINAAACEIDPGLKYVRERNVLHQRFTAKPLPSGTGNNQFSIVFT